MCTRRTRRSIVEQEEEEMVRYPFDARGVGIVVGGGAGGGGGGHGGTQGNTCHARKSLEVVQPGFSDRRKEVECWRAEKQR